MSRIIVKQLPKNITEEKLRSLFGTRGTITDIQLKYTSDGKFRQFCFIGYRSEAEAQSALEFFNNSCIQTSRIRVEICGALGSTKPQNSTAVKGRKEGEAEQKEKDKKEGRTEKKEKDSKVDEILGEHKDDPDFQEFLKAHDKNRTLWANDAGGAPAEDPEPKTMEPESDAEEDEAEDEEDSEEVEEAPVEAEEKLAAAPISDLEYMKSLMSNGTANQKDAAEKEATKKDATAKKETAKKSKDDLDLFTIKIHNFPYKAKRQEVLKFFKPIKPYSVRLPQNVHGFCYVGFKAEKDMARAMLKNKSFLRGKQVFFSEFTEKNKISKEKYKERVAADEAAGRNPKWSKQEENAKNEESIADSGRIFFRNLAFTVTEDDLQEVFATFGPVAEISLPVDAVTRQIKGFGVVTFVMPEHAVLAFNKLDGTVFHGRLLHLIPGRSPDKEEVDENDDGLSFRKKKELKLKANAQKSVGWNSLFMGPNAVAELISKKFGMSKDEVLDTTDGGSSAAVRIALGETQIVIEMKKFLEEQGVSLTAFEGPANKRSKTVLLAKNLPADTTVAELTPVFAKFGPLGRLVLPPSGVTALIEYCDPSEARQAFKKLAYSKFKTLPLFLEWAPEQVFKTTHDGVPLIPKVEAPQAPTEAVVEEAPKEEQPEEAQPEEVDEMADEPPEANTTLFLRNLNFSTVPETVRNHFKLLGPVHTVEVARRRDAENPRQFVSLGYGFIQFKRSATAEMALKRMQNTMIDGKTVELKRSDRTLKTADTGAQQQRVKNSKQTGTKILVRNIPFQARLKEVRDIFKAFGEISSLRMPQKLTPGETTHRGFGFVDFSTKSDAKKAFEALSQSTHLYGRRLVLEWASVDDTDDVEAMRKRTAEEFRSAGASAKRSRKANFDAETILAGKNQGSDDEEEEEGKGIF